ncbi:MAG: bacillithiol biosynthesis cysteine-adding enzyme BshC [Bacteroidia bacterium]
MSLKKSEIELAQTAQFSNLMLNYITGDSSIRSLYTYMPDIDSFENAIKDKSKEQINRELLVDVLSAQYANIEKADLQLTAIESLRQSNTFTVCTGHQLCLFTGPLYFIYKILSTINTAEELKKQYPDYNFVPVYWMASEDHDFEEIKSANLFGKKLVWDNEHAKGAVGDLSTVSMATVLNELEAIAGNTDNAKEWVALMREAYLKHATLSEATRWLVHQLFGKYPLVIVDGNDKRLKQEFITTIEDDIFNTTNYNLVNQTIVAMDALGIKAQVNPRKINCFYMLDGMRERIEFVDNTYKVLNTTIEFTAEQLKKELADFPERFSPNVVLRPLYQQKILPNLAYVGGPGEIAYWLEYKSMFDAHKISFPILIPRNFALLMDAKSEQQVSKLGFTILDLFDDTETLIKRFLTKNGGEALLLKEQEQTLVAVFEQISAKAITIDATLKGSVEAELQKALNSIKAIETKLTRAEKQKQETSLNQIKKLKEKFFPTGSLQERYDNITPYYLKQGNGFIDDLKTVFNPFEYKMLVLHTE